MVFRFRKTNICTVEPKFQILKMEIRIFFCYFSDYPNLRHIATKRALDLMFGTENSVAD